MREEKKHSIDRFNVAPHTHTQKLIATVCLFTESIRFVDGQPIQPEALTYYLYSPIGCGYHTYSIYVCFHFFFVISIFLYRLHNTWEYKYILLIITVLVAFIFVFIFISIFFYIKIRSIFIRN